MQNILTINNLVKDYAKLRAVDGLSFEVKAGNCFGLLGPNGAGKTTTLEMIEGITKPTSGQILYKGKPIGPSFKQEAGFLFQSTALQEHLTVEETLTLFKKLYEKTLPIAKLIEMCSLEPILKQDNRKLSGGQRQRMLLALALINDPDLIFLDEPTTGLDPQSRRNFWELIDSIKHENKTVILTTHYMEEAEKLCDQVAIIDQGKILENDSPEILLRKHFDDVVLHLPEANFKSTTMELEQLKQRFDCKITQNQVQIRTKDVPETLALLNNEKIDLSRLEIRSRNLEDLFLKLTGKDLRN